MNYDQMREEQRRIQEQQREEQRRADELRRQEAIREERRRSGRRDDADKRLAKKPPTATVLHLGQAARGRVISR